MITEQFVSSEFRKCGKELTPTQADTVMNFMANLCKVLDSERIGIVVRCDGRDVTLVLELAV